MADTRLYIQAQTFTLAVGISTTDTSITLTSFNFPDGTAIASGDVGSVNYGTLEAGTSREEQISFTGITTNGDGTVTLTGVTRGLGFGATDTYSEQSALKKQHGAGSTFIISNNPAFYNEFVNKYNDETIVGTLTVPTPTAAGHAVTKAYADALVTSGLSQNKVVVSGTAGESVAAGDLLYFDDTDNEWKKTDANTATSINEVILGIAQGTGSDGGAITDGVLLYGQDETQTGLTPGAVYYASDTAGEISATAGTNEKKIGWASETTVLYFDPYHGELPTGAEKAAMAGGGDFGSPSTDNKFVTKDFTKNKPPTIIEFNSSGTWTKPTGLNYIIVEGVGAGGGGGQSVSSGGGEGSGALTGGSGGYFKKIISADSLGATETVTIGAGGLGAPSSGSTTGGTGGTTSFGSHCQSTGGTGGTSGESAFGVGGVATGGDININGNNGISGGTDGTDNGNNAIIPGGYTPSVLGSKGRGGAVGLGSLGVAGLAGGDGYIVVTEFYS